MDKEKLYLVVSSNSAIRAQALNKHYFKPSKLFKPLRDHLKVIGFDTRSTDVFCIEEDAYGIPSLGKPVLEDRYSFLGIEDTLAYVDVEYPRVTMVAIVFLGKGNWVFKVLTNDDETIWIYPKAFTKPFGALEEKEKIKVPDYVGHYIRGIRDKIRWEFDFTDIFEVEPDEGIDIEEVNEWLAEDGNIYNLLEAILNGFETYQSYIHDCYVQDYLTKAYLHTGENGFYWSHSLEGAYKTPSNDIPDFLNGSNIRFVNVLGKANDK